MRTFLKTIWSDEAGQDLIEYALVAALVAVGGAAILPEAIHGGLSHIYSRVSSCLDRFGSGNG